MRLLVRVLECVVKTLLSSRSRSGGVPLCRLPQVSRHPVLYPKIAVSEVDLVVETEK